MNLLLLPHQLFNKKYINKKYKIILWEYPHYFCKYKYNKKKLILHRSSMKSYFFYLKKLGFDITYIEFRDSINIKLNYYMFDPVDKLYFNFNVTFIETPNFLLTKNEYSKYREKTEHFIFNNFYMWSKKELQIIPDIKSQDKKNRKKIPNTLDIPLTDSLNNTKEIIFIKEAQIYVNKYFPDNPGSCDNFIFPITHYTCKKWLKKWIKIKFKLFGTYQDSIDVSKSYLFHSALSSSINIGLINPIEIINEIKKYKDKIPINSYEGYIRQLFWREYQRYCYIYFNFNNKNYFQNTKKLNKEWYIGNTEIIPINDCIIRGFEQGYLSHIERLMIIGNYMVLSGISPKEGFKWFMELSCDSYEWVMCQNVLDMVFFVSGGVTMRRPYISSSNYILKMSNYTKGDWCDKLDLLYKNFKKEKKNKLWKFRYYFPGL